MLWWLMSSKICKLCILPTWIKESTNTAAFFSGSFLVVRRFTNSTKKWGEASGKNNSGIRALMVSLENEWSFSLERQPSFLSGTSGSILNNSKMIVSIFCKISSEGLLGISILRRILAFSSDNSISRNSS